MSSRKRLGEVLRERNQISQVDLDRAIEAQQNKYVHLGELMLERGFVAKKDLIEALGEVSHTPYVDCETTEIEPALLAKVPREVAKRCAVLPVEIHGGKLVVAMAEPQNLAILDELRFSTGMEIAPRFAFRREVLAAIEKRYGAVEKSGAAPIRAPHAFADTDVEFISFSSLQRNKEAMAEIQAELQRKSKTTPAVRVVAAMITAAAQKQASDIHIEPQANETSIRFRVDGVLREYERVPRSLQNSVVSRVKILSDMDISERRAPQDGRFLVKILSRKIDLRVSTLPTQYGEKVVMRLLEASAPLQDFAALGIPEAIVPKLTRILAQPQGMLLVTGPTGSGKSTTLYSALNMLRKPTINIVTVEDPVEYVLQGLNQVQVNNKAGLTFASCLRSILRQDPNIIMVGEIRDKETAEIAIKAAQTGHLVLSTLHTNDSISSITRLLDIGVPGFQIASSVSAIIAQRLVRRLCTCRAEAPVSPEYVAWLTQAGLQDIPAVQRVPNGCRECDLTGYKGRIGIYEMLELDANIRGAVRTEARNDEIRLLARQAGMKLMQEYALERVREGLTTLDEVQRVIPFEPLSGATCGSCGREVSAGFSFCPHCGERKETHGWAAEAPAALVAQGAGRK
jgi:type IV pilus assembly protein PilB